MTDTRLMDAILIERGQRGDTEAVDELLRKNQLRAFQYALRMTRHVEDASDLVSDSFIRIHRAISRFQVNASFSTWMFRILRNCFLDTHKRKRVLVTASLDSPFELDNGIVFAQPIDPSESPLEASMRSDHREQVRSAVDLLPLPQRQLMLMYHVEDLTYDEIAKVLELPTGTIKSKLYRARANLRSIIEGDASLLYLAEIG